ncbi:hypothetical protein GAPWK_1835 [Gilliamella apicola]|nr:hypothetical protein GAPWK_1835 [Gilliamella apicola]
MFSDQYIYLIYRIFIFSLVDNSAKEFFLNTAGLFAQK